MQRSLAIALIVAAGWSDAARAQEMSLPTYSPAVTAAFAGTDTLGLHLRELRDQQGWDDDDGDARAVPAASPATLRYAPSTQRRAANLASFVRKSRAVDPAGAADLEKLFAQGDIIDKISAALAPAGMRIDDVADAYTMWWITAWMATHGRNDVTSSATNKAVRAQAARALLSAPEFARASDAAKQELAESLLIQATLIDGAIEQSKNDPAMLRNIGAAVNQGAKGMGIDLATMELTEKGFVSARTGSVGGHGSSALSYGLVAAAAGGMGVGGALFFSRRGK